MERNRLTLLLPIHAHRQGAIHRDIKPGNIMLTRQGTTNDYVKVVDFGIAKMAEEAQRLTRMGEVWGSPIYMSPEQCMGAPVDARSDIYSLGIVMYESLTGKVPFLGRNYADTMTKQISDDPAPFAEDSTRSKNSRQSRKNCHGRHGKTTRESLSVTGAHAQRSRGSAQCQGNNRTATAYHSQKQQSKSLGNRHEEA